MRAQNTVPTYKIIKKKTRLQICKRILPVFQAKLFLADSAYGALSLACAAIDTFVGVDLVFIRAFGNRAYGALSLAAAAFDALVADNSGHSSTLLYFFIINLLYHGILYL